MVYAQLNDNLKTQICICFKFDIQMSIIHILPTLDFKYLQIRVASWLSLTRWDDHDLDRGRDKTKQ